ncbi:MAG: MFS transporter, partial [Thermoprotei archaeon]
LVYGAVGSHYVELQVLGYFAFALTVIAFAIRYLVPESARWLAHVGRVEKAKEVTSRLDTDEYATPKPLNKRTSLFGRYLLLLVIGISQYLTYGLMAYVVADYYFSGNTVNVVADYYFSGNTVNLVVLIANVAASATGFIIPLFITKVSMRKYGFGVYLGGTLSMIPIFFTVDTLGSNIELFYLFLAMNMAFSEMAWSVRTVLEPLLMPTRIRAFMIGLIRLGPIIGYTASLYLTSTLGLHQFVEYNLALWAVGALAMLYWLIKGYDVHGVSLEDTAGEGLSVKESVRSPSGSK